MAERFSLRQGPRAGGSPRVTVRSLWIGSVVPVIVGLLMAMPVNAARPPAFAAVRPPSPGAKHAPVLAATHGRMPSGAHAPTAPATRQPTASPLLPPVTPACVSSPFGPRVLANLPQAGTFHYGIDLPAPEGAPVSAIAPGHVIRVQRKGPGGLEILVQHDGFVGVYSHLGMVTPTIAEGQRVVFGGQKIGVVGHTGLTLGFHLYFGMIVGGRPVDPAPYLAVLPCSGGTATHAVPTDGKLRPSRIYAGR